MQGYLIAIDELTEGPKDLPQKLLARHINDGMKAAVVGYVADSVSIPLLTTADGWRVKLTAFPTARYGTRRGTVMQEAWSRTWDGTSYPLRDSLKKKGSRYGNQFAMPYGIMPTAPPPVRSVTTRWWPRIGIYGCLDMSSTGSPASS